MKKTWNDEDLAYLLANYADRTNAELGIVFGCNELAVMNAARRHGAKKSSAYIYSINKPLKRELFLRTCAELISKPTGTCKSEMVARTGANPSSVNGFLYKALRAREVFSAGKLAQMRYFLTAEAAATGAILLAAEKKLRREIMVQRKRARERASYIPRPPKPVKVKAVKPPRAKKIAIPKLVKLPKLPKVPKPRRAAVVAQRGPAYQDQPADMRHAKITRIPTPVSPYAVPSNYRGIFSAAGIGRDVQTGNAW